MSETMMKEQPEGSSVAPAGGSASGRATAVQTSTDAATWWQQHDERVYQCIKLWVEQWWESESRGLHEAVGEIFGEHRASIRETLTNLKERIVRLETTSNFEERLAKLAHEVKRGSEIPQGELLAKIEGSARSMSPMGLPIWMRVFANSQSALVNSRKPTASKRASLSLLMR